MQCVFVKIFPKRMIKQCDTFIFNLSFDAYARAVFTGFSKQKTRFISLPAFQRRVFEISNETVN